VQLFYDIALAGLRDLGYAPDPLVGTRMTVLRMLAFVPGAASGTGDASAPAAKPSLRSTLRQSQQTAPAAPESQPAEVIAPPAPQSSGAVADAATVNAPSQGDTPTPAGNWPDLVQSLHISGMAGQLARHAVCHDLGAALDNGADDHSVITLELPRAHEHLATESARSKLQAALNAHWQPHKAPKVRIQMVDSVDDSPAQQAEQAADARQQEAVQAIRNDPNVQQLQERLGARLRTDSIKPNSL